MNLELVLSHLKHKVSNKQLSITNFFGIKVICTQVVQQLCPCLQTL
jgi:hypothetical protein